MSKAIKKANQIRQLERDKLDLEGKLRIGEQIRESLAKRLAKLDLENRAMRKARRGPWFRVKAWWRTRRKR